MPTDLERQQAEFLLGPWLIGCFLDVLFQGVLFCQFVHYFEWHATDKLPLRLAVSGLLILTTLKSIQAFALIWIQLILHFNDLEGAILLNYTSWWQTGNALMVASIGIYVQSFFVYRLSVISGRNWFVVGPIAVILVFAYVSICVATYYISLGADVGPKIATWFANHLSAVFAGDVLITTSTAFFLIRSKKDVSPQTVGIISALIRLTFQTGAPATICATFNLIFSQVYSGDHKLISTAFNMALPKLYAFSMMWTLNARHAIRAARARHFSSAPPIVPFRRDVELDLYSQVRVQTHVETSTQEVDIREMFHHPDEQHTSQSHDSKKLAAAV